MAFDQNLISNDLRPLNVARTVNDEPRIAPVITTTRNVEGFCPNPSQNVEGYCKGMPVYYSTMAPSPGIVGLGYRNMAVPVSDVSGWGAPQVQLPVGQMVRGNPGIGLGGNGSVGSRVSNGSGTDQTSDEGGDDSVSVRKVKFLSSFGGKILPRPSDGMLRYVGGQTRIISVRRDVSYGELVQRMEDVYGQPLVIKYQLPGEDLDALVSVSSSDDLENMMDENSKLNERSSDGSAKLRVFLFLPAELDPAGMVRVMDLNDSGKIYLDAINGIVEGVVGGDIMRKESIASAASTQNSELSGAEGFDNLTLANKGLVTETQTIKTASPRENSATSHEKTSRLVCLKPSPDAYVETSAVSLGIPVAMSEPSQPFSAHPIDMERSVAHTLQQQQQQLLVFESQQQQQQQQLLGFESQQQQQLGFDAQQQLLSFESQQQQQQLGVDVQQPRVEFSPHTPHFQAQIASRQAHGDYVQVPGQLRFPRAQLLGTPGSVNPHQFVCPVHMTMNPTSSYVTLRPNMIQPTMPAQSQQAQLDTYSDGSVFAPRFIQLSVNQNYNGYQAQVQPAVVGGGFGWRPVPPPDQIVYSDGVVTHQPENIPEKESVMSGDSNSVYHSPRQDDDLRAWQTNTEFLGVNTQPRFQGHMSPQFVAPQSETVGIYQNLEARHENDKIVIQNVDYADHCKIPVPPGIVGLASDVQSTYGMFTGTTSQYCQEVKLQQPLVPTQCEIKSDALANKRMYNNTSPVVGASVQVAEHSVQALPDNFSCNYPGIVLKEEALECSTSSTNVKPVQGRMEAIGTYPSDISVNNEHNYSLVDRARYGDILDPKQQQILPIEIHSDNISSKPMLVDTRQITSIEPSQCSNTEMSYPNQFRPVESPEVEQVHTLGNQGPYLHAGTRIPQMACNEIAYAETAFPGALSTYVTDKIQPITEWKDDTTWLQSSSNAPTSLSPPNRIGEIQDYSNSFFSNQDPWSTWHDAHLLPPRSNKTLTKKEAFQTRDPFVENFFENSRNTEVRLENEHQLPLGDMHREFSLEHIQSSKGSGEEFIKQELQAVAEGVAASVLSPESASAYEWNESVSEESQDIGTQSSIVEKQHRAQVEDMQTKLPEKVNFGFPASDGIGRLQIILNSDLEELQELGSGTFGTVYHGKWRGTDVAIKRINERCFVGKPSEQERMRDDFWNEAINLADLHHPNVVAFYGVVLDGPGGSVATVTEFMVNGSLRTALQKNERNLDKRKRLLIAMDVAFGMEYLHGKNIVHFDLKSDNLLVNLRDQHRPICKVGDLGLSKVKCQTLISGGVRGTLPWMAPELLNGSSSLVSEKVDVFSFGIVMWELLTGDEPYADLHYGAIIGGIVSNTLRPPIPECCDLEWRSLMEKCWSADPPERPNFTEIANQLRAMAAKIPLKGQSNPQPELIQK